MVFRTRFIGCRRCWWRRALASRTRFPAMGVPRLRGGAGIFFDRVQGNPTMNMAANPPTSFSPTLYYSTFPDLVASANSALLAPSTISHSLYGKGTMPQNYQYTLGIQRMVAVQRSSKWPMSATSRAICCGSATSTRYRWGAVPQSASENRDSTTNAAFANNFLRPYAGYGRHSGIRIQRHVELQLFAGRHEHAHAKGLPDAELRTPSARRWVPPTATPRR